MDGLLNINKPLGLTSAQALERVREILGQRKSGHAGALDPLAEGVLIVCLGRATKLVESLMDQPKIYRATAVLDATSESFDRERPLVPVPVLDPPDLGRLRSVLSGFEGTIEQVPPASSAVKVRGRPAYKLSRAGRPPVLRPRTTRIYWIHVRQYEWPQLEFEVACGRGTYIRALIRDIGERLGSGGCLTGLVRLAVGPFTADESWSLEQLEGAGERTCAVIPLETVRAMLRDPMEIPARPS